MTRKKEKVQYLNLTGRVLFITSIIATIGLFSAEILIQERSTTISSLFNALEFIFAIILGWFFQKISSIEELNRSLKTYALSAYRRIYDIHLSIERVQQELLGMRKKYPADQTHDLDIISAHMKQLWDTVKSARYDWADILGDEIEKKKRIEELERKVQIASTKDKASENEVINHELEQMREDIRSLRSELPIIMQELAPGQSGFFPRDGIISLDIRKYFETIVNTLSFLPLQVYTNHPIDPEQMTDNTIFLQEDHGMGQMHLSLLDENFEFLGDIKNSMAIQGVYDKDYFETLIDFIIADYGKECIGPSGIKLNNVRFMAGPTEYYLTLMIPFSVG